MTDLASFYSAKVENNQVQLRHLKRSIFYTAALRLVTFIVLVSLLYFFFTGSNNTLVIGSIAALVLFLFLVKRSATLNAKKLLYENLLFVNSNELGIIKGEKNKFDNGQAASSGESYYADLDIFGENSIFHLLNRTSTIHGSQMLINRLKHTLTDPNVIKKHQSAIKQLTDQHVIREGIIAKSLMHKDIGNNLENIQHWLNEPAQILTNKWLMFARYILPLVNLVTLALSIYLEHYVFLVASVFLCWLHIGHVSKYIQKQHALLGKRQQALSQYAIILYEFFKVNAGDAALLKELKEVTGNAQKEIDRLAHLSNLLDQRMNLLVNIFLNSFLLYDIQVAISLEKWKQKNSTNFHVWMDAIANIECLTSLSTFAFNHPTFCYPQLKGELNIEATNLAHPLISENERVANDISLGKNSRLLLITGSNMSGKTTYLRSIGVNVVLAQCGAPVCASTFTFSPLDIFSSIRISDSLHEHTSYFMAELKRLSEIKDGIAINKPSLVLIDEILRGTNSEDKYFGSAEFVKQLVQYNCLSLFATHDLKLSELQKEFEGVIENYCFESVIKDDELMFDYTVRKGVAQNKNASFLMKKMKII